MQTRRPDNTNASTERPAKRPRTDDGQEARIGPDKRYAQNIRKPEEGDILCDRAPSVSRHLGNLYMTDTLKQVANQYHNPASSLTRRDIGVSVLTHFHKDNLRFLRQDNDTKLWHEIPDQQALSKIHRSLARMKPVAEENASDLGSDARPPSSRDNTNASTERPAKRPRTDDGQVTPIRTKTLAKNISKPTDRDILCGRGAGVNHHPGTRHKLETIREQADTYKNTPASSRQKVCRDVLSQFHADGRRYLKQDHTTGLWNEITDKDATTKIGQGFREAILAAARPKSDPTIIKPKPDDIVGGRTNIHLQHAARAHVEEYTNSLSDSKKREIISDIADEMRSDGRRFIEKNKETETWHEMSDVRVAQKITSAILRARGQVGQD